LGGAGNYYIYVPKGTKKFYTVRNYPIRLVNPKGVNFYADGNEKIVELSVADDEWGWWLCQLQLETTYFVGIPPLVSQQPKSFFFAD
ncbi:MAG: hypothetical protein J7527_18110, partial [Chitinophagaceae bacterium]|nr:hypothetical protein [Chitinophagaceae bacterium]